MAYELFQFNLGTGEAQGYVLRGTGEHEGTNETISANDMRAFACKLGEGLAGYLDKRFLLAHSDLLAAASGMETRQGQDRETGLGAKHDSPTRQGDAQPIPPVINTGESE